MLNFLKLVDTLLSSETLQKLLGSPIFSARRRIDADRACRMSVIETHAQVSNLVGVDRLSEDGFLSVSGDGAERNEIIGSSVRKWVVTLVQRAASIVVLA